MNCGCSGTCGCCEGVEPLTPVAVTNPPGRDALAYRVGTHGSFLETMLARLSQHAREDGERPLRALRTREPDDAAVALLDAWATVAEILTFYQERIANEGFLGTATERRSVVELGRLVGYRPRPGVAATTYLAYRLEADARVTIEPGNRVQSLPAPGELPQTFETVESVEARGEWNALAVRSTRPVDGPGLLRSGSDRPLYFRGVATGLVPNAAVLVDTGTSQALFRVVEVEPDSTADRTRVTVTPWEAGARIARGRKADDVPREVGPALAADVDRLLGAPVPTARRPGALVRTVTAQLERVRTNLMLGISEGELQELVADDVLVAVRDARDAARRPAASTVAWLDEVEAVLRAAGEQAIARAAAPAPRATPIGSTLEALAEPPSTPPASPRELRPTLETTFGPGSDSVPRLLTAARPELEPVLYDAWRNLEATPPSELRVYAMRLRSAPFGHSAPLEPVLDDEGRVVGTREWTLERSGPRIRERFQIAIAIPDSPLGSPPPPVGLDVQIGRVSKHFDIPLSQLLQGPVRLPFPEAREVLEVALTLPSPSPVTPGTLELRLLERTATFTVTLGTPPEEEAVGPTGPSLRWTSEGADPADVRFTLVQPPIIGLVQLLSGWVVSIGGTLLGPAGTPTEDPFIVSLDAPQPDVVPGGWVAVDRPVAEDSPPRGGLIISRITGVTEASRADYGITGRSTLVGLERPWLALGPRGDTFEVIRESAVYVQSEELDLLEQPIEPREEPVCGHEIPLDRLYDGLAPGRWLAVSGERTDVVSTDGTPVEGVQAVEIAMLAAVRQEVDLAEPGARTRSTLVLAEPLAYCYRRDTIAIAANVVKATHGETREEVLGSGDGSVPNQAFDLRQKPLTYVPAVTTSGVESTLRVAVAGVRWHPADSVVGLSPTDRRWVASTADDDTTTVTFGNGVEGARLPTGQENVAAVYRFGIGRAANVGADRLSLLTTRPAGVLGVTNPQAASGGADREGRDEARRNIPLAVTALDRIVSVQDYADFARTFAGIGKASSVRLPGGVHVTIAGEDDIPILRTSDLFQNLRRALAIFGEPFQPFALDVRELRMLVIVASVRVDPDHDWETVEPAVRRALEDRFAFARRELGQDVTRSEVLSAAQAVPGVIYVDVDILDTLGEREVEQELTTPSPGGLAAGLGLHERLHARLAHAATPPAVVPAELIVLRPDVPQTLTLLEII